MKRTILLLLSASILGVSLSSYTNGIAGNGLNRTGSDGSTPGCDGSGCHTNSYNSNLIVSIDINGSMADNGKYVPNSIYTITLKGKYSNGGNYPTFGFQLSGSGANDGNFVISSSNLVKRVIIPYEIVEHSQPIAGTPGNNYLTTFYWQSPPQGAGDMTFYLTMLAANNDGSTNGDIANYYNRTLQETAPNNVPSIDDIAAIDCYPNPVKDKVNLAFSNATKGVYGISIFNLSGQRLQQQMFQVDQANAQTSFDLTALNSGMYLMTIVKNGAQKTITVIKQ